jgi:glycosyltransferase involved in cell wall biosynthesis
MKPLQALSPTKRSLPMSTRATSSALPTTRGLSRLRQPGGIGVLLKVPEYMACEKAVVTTSVPPIPEAVDDGMTGLLVPPGNVGSLSEASGKLMEDKSFRERLGRERRKAVVERYSWGSLLVAFERVLEVAAGVRDEKGGALL